MQVKPYDPESRAWSSGPTSHGNAVPAGRVFSSPEDFNLQLAQWPPTANARLHKLTGTRLDLLAADKAAMLALPPVPPVIGFTSRVRLPEDYYVRMGSNDYFSVHPEAIASSSTSPSTSEPSRSPWTPGPSAPTPGSEEPDSPSTQTTLRR
ncbi:Mu transposase domain-containing protein [Arthrobacter sp. BA34(2011)]